MRFCLKTVQKLKFVANRCQNLLYFVHGLCLRRAVELADVLGYDIVWQKRHE